MARMMTLRLTFLPLLLLFHFPGPGVAASLPLSPHPPDFILGSPQVVGDKVVATWLPVDGAGSYVVYLDGKRVGEVTFHQWVGSVPAVTGVFRLEVAARDGEGREGPRSVPRTFSTLPPRAPPLEHQLDPLNGVISLWWEATDGMVTSLLWQAPAPEGPWTLLFEGRQNSVLNLKVEFDRDYHFALSVKDIQGRESEKGPSLAVRVPRPLPLPPLSWFEGRPYLASGRAVLTWNGIEPAVRYLVYQDDRQVGETVEPLFLSPLPPGPGIYRFQVAAVDREGVVGERSPPAALEIPALPAPVGLKAGPGKGGAKGGAKEGEGVALEWAALEGAVEYLVFRRDQSGKGWGEAGRTRLPRWTGSPLPPGRMGSFAVAGVDGKARVGERSAPLKLRGSDGGAPRNIGLPPPRWRETGRGGVEVAGRRIHLYFQSVEGAVFYRVYLNGRPHAEAGLPTWHGDAGTGVWYARGEYLSWSSLLDVPGRFRFEVAGVDGEGEEGPRSEPVEVVIP